MEQHQSDQINRLTLVSVIFLPITFVTGFFGMNFNWMIANIGDRRAFLALGVALPKSSSADRRAVSPARAPPRRAQARGRPAAGSAQAAGAAAVRSVAIKA